MRSSARISATLLAGVAFALSVPVVPASARTHAPSKYGGTLVVGMALGEASALDPTTTLNGAADLILRPMCQKLYAFDATTQPVPSLAAALPVLSKDKLSYTIELRKGARFNDGTPFDAQAVVTTVQRYMTHPRSNGFTDYAGVDSVSASGPYTVVYRLKARDSTFVGGNPYVLSPTQLDKLGDGFATNPVCVGPFMFDHRVADDNVTLVKSPYYYDRNNVYLDKIVYKPMSDTAAAAAALKAGDIQVLSSVSSTELEAVRQTSSLRVIQAPNFGWFGVTFNIGNKYGVGSPPYALPDKPFASSARLRQAFEEAIDRDTLNKVLFDGLYQISCTPVAPANTAWYKATKVPCTQYNPEHAKKLVAEWGLGFLHPTVHLQTTTATDQLRLAQFIQAQEAAVGINVVIDSGNGLTAVAAAGNFDARIGSWTPGNIDPHANIFQFLATSGPRNYGGYSTPRLDMILNNGLKATSTQARSTLYHVAQQIIQGDRPIVYLYNPVTFAAFSTDVTGVYLSFNGGMRVEKARYR